jgi:hypothetical protein
VPDGTTGHAYVLQVDTSTTDQKRNQRPHVNRHNPRTQCDRPGAGLRPSRHDAQHLQVLRKYLARPLRVVGRLSTKLVGKSELGYCQK